MLNDLGMAAVYGLGAGIFFVGYLMFEVPNNLILLRVGAGAGSRIAVTWGLISAAMMFVTTPTSFYVMRFLLGVAEAGFIPAILLYLTYWFPSSQRNEVTVTLFLTGIPMSGVVGSPCRAGSCRRWAARRLAGWQWLFLLEGIPTVLIGVAAFFFLDDRVADAKWLSEQEKALIERNLREDGAGQNKLHTLRDGLLSPRILLLSAIYFCFTMGLYGVSFTAAVAGQGGGRVEHDGHRPAVGPAVCRRDPGDDPGGAELRLAGRTALAPGGAGRDRGDRLVPERALCQQHRLGRDRADGGTMGVMTTISQFWAVPRRSLGGAAAAAGIALANSVRQHFRRDQPLSDRLDATTTGSTGGGIVGIAASMVLGSLLTFLVPARTSIPRRQARS